MGLVDTNEAVEHFRRVIEATENNGAYNEGFIDALEFCIATLSTMPTAELIHCKDCEWWTKQDKSLQGRCELMQMYPTGWWFAETRRRGLKMEVKNSDGIGVWVGFILGVVVAAVLCTYMWLEPAMECEEYKQIVAEQQAIIERYQIQNETMMQIIDGMLEEGDNARFNQQTGGD